MRKYLLLGAAAIVVLGVGAYALAIYPSRQFRAGLDQAIAKLPPGHTVTYGGAHYSLLTRTAELTDVVIRGPGSNPYDVKIADLSVRGPALDFQDAWSRAAANPAALRPEQALPVADRIEIRKLAVHNGDGDGTIGAASLDRPRVYPWAILHPGAPKLSDFQSALRAVIQSRNDLQQERQNDLPSPEDLEALQERQLTALAPLVRIEAALVLGSGYEGFTIQDASFSFHQPAAGTVAAHTVSVSIQNAGAKIFDRGEGGDIVMGGLAEDVGRDLKVTVEHVSQTGLSARAPLMRVIDGGPLAMATLDGAVLKRMQFDGMITTGPKGGPVKLQSVNFSDLAFDRGFLKSGSFAVSSLALSSAGMPDAQSRQLFRQLGIATMTISLGASYHWDADKRAATVREAALKVDELGALMVSADLANVGPGAEPAQPTLAGGSVRYADASLIDRLLSGGGKRSPAEAATVRRLFAAGLTQQIAHLGLGSKVGASAKAIADFAAKPQSLTITLAPPTPVPLADLETIGQGGLPNLITALGLSVTANQ